MPETQEILERLRADIASIRSPGLWTVSLNDKNLRWVGEPNGWRSLGELADDLELILGPPQ